MEYKFYKNRYELRDGRIVLYVQPNSKKGIKYARILKPDGGYIGFSTKTSNLGEAARIAEDLYDEMRENVRKGLPSATLTFRQLWVKWWSLYGPIKKSARKSTILQHMELYFLPYFGTAPINAITNAKMEDYWAWRLNYWTQGPGVELLKTGNIRFHNPNPSGATLKTERTSFLQVLRWGHSQGFINVLPTSEPPIKSKSAKEVARPAFTYQEYLKITNHLRDKALKNNRGPVHTQYGQRMFRNFVRIGFSTGMRPNEIFSLKWKHVSTFMRGEEVYYRILVPPETKTGTRTVIPMQSIVTAISELEMYSKFREPEDHLITTWAGNRLRDYSKSFDKLIYEMGIPYDDNGKKRTPYSMRHSYITFRILYGGVSKSDVARNCGTSVGEIDNHYDHVLNEQKAETLTNLDHALVKKEHEYSDTLHEILRKL